MKRLVICFLAVACIAALAGIDPAFTRAGGDETKKKLEQMRKELDELNAKEKALAKQRDDLQKAIVELQREANRRAEDLRKQQEIEQKKFDEADKKKHHVKIELRGKITQLKQYGQFIQHDTWYVLTNETYWPLDIGNNKALLESVKKLNGKPVVLTGSISTAKRTTPLYQPVLPDFDIGSGPFPVRPGSGQPRIGPGYTFTTEVQLPVVVDSVRLFEEK